MLDYNSLKPHDLSHLVDSRIGNPDAVVTNLLDDFDFTDLEWEALNGGTAVNATTIGSAGPNQGLKIDLSLTVGKTYIVHLKGHNYGTDFELRNYSGSNLGAVTNSDVGAFDLWGVVQATDEGMGLSIDGPGIVVMESLWFGEWSGEELVPDSDYNFAINKLDLTGGFGWSYYGTNTIEQDGNFIKCTYVDNSNGMHCTFGSVSDSCWENFNPGKLDLIFKYKTSVGASMQVSAYDGSLYTSYDLNGDGNEHIISIRVDLLSGSGPVVRWPNMGAGEIVWVEVMSIKKVTGLVAAYNMIPSPEGVLVDVSGEGNNGTIVSADVSSKDGMLFDGSRGDINILDLNGLYASTFCLRFTVSDFSANRCLLAAGSTQIFIRFLSSNSLNIQFFNGTGLSSVSIAGTFLADEWYNLCAIYVPEAGIMAYLNGILIQAPNDSDFTGWSAITPANLGNRNNADYHKGEIADVRIFNYAFNEQEAIDYHNSFAKQVEQKHAFDDLGVGSTIG